jgi:hypothetical protein
MAYPNSDKHAPEPGTVKKSLADWKPGSEGEQAAEVGSPDDFGVHASRSSRGERDYTNRNTKQSDPGAAQPWSREHDGNRQAGASAHDSGPGSGSGGDIDTDVVGVGFGGVAQSGPGGDPGMAATDGTSREFASGGPATGVVPPHANDFSGSTYTGADRSAGGDSQGSDAAVSGNRDDDRDDSFVGEVSSDEAAGGESEPDRDQLEPGA